MAKENRKCHVCDTAYYYCPSCNTKDPAWMTTFCGETCKNIWELLSKNGVGHMSAQDTMREIKKITLPKTLKENVRKHVQKLDNETRPVIAADVEQKQYKNKFKKHEELVEEDKVL